MSQQIPNIFHFCYFGNKQFTIIDYLAIKSAFIVNKPSIMFFYCTNEPTGYWWEKAKGYIQIIPIDPPKRINNININLPHHQADLVRLQKLIEFGDIYLDLDVICAKPFAPLLSYDFVMGEEIVDTTVMGLCNAVLLSKKSAKFAIKWLEGYEQETSLWNGFRSQGFDMYWNEMSVKYPFYLSKLYSEDINIVDAKKFFSPSYVPIELAHFFFEDTNNFEEAYCHHLWNTITYDNYLKNFTFENIQNGTSTFCKLAKKFL